MTDYDDIGKRMMRLAVGELFVDSGPSVGIQFGHGAGTARIDGVVADLVAVEIESRVPKQIRGAMLDLVLHACPRKLLVLMPGYIGNPEIIVNQSNTILGRFLEPNTFRVVLITDDLEASISKVRTALADLGVELQTT